jgi:hypothetical protein
MRRVSGKGRRNPSHFHATSWALANLCENFLFSKIFLGFFWKKIYIFFQARMQMPRQGSPSELTTHEP